MVHILPLRMKDYFKKKSKPNADASGFFVKNLINAVLIGSILIIEFYKIEAN